MKSIFVSELKFVGHHGVYEEERRDGRTFVANVILYLDDETQTLDTDLLTTVDYRMICEVVLRHGTGPSVQLIETLAHQMILDLFELSPLVKSIDLKLSKRATGVPGDPSWVGVQVVTSLDEFKSL